MISITEYLSSKVKAVDGSNDMITMLNPDFIQLLKKKCPTFFAEAENFCRKKHNEDALGYLIAAWAEPDAFGKMEPLLTDEELKEFENTMRDDAVDEVQRFYDEYAK